MKKIPLFATTALFTILLACGESPKDNTTNAPSSMIQSSDKYDPNRGEGKWTAENIGLTDEINEAMAAEGEKISNTKCLSCHKLTEERLVGPGWKGATVRRSPEWLMNFITNPDPMIDKDPEVQAMLELCLVRMPNQNLSDEESRNILEFMRKNDKTK